MEEEGTRGICSLCGGVKEGSLTSYEEDLEVIKTVELDLRSLIGGGGVALLFCVECSELVGEAKRLQDLVRTLTSQLDEVVSKVKGKYEEGRAKGSSAEVKEQESKDVVWVKQEMEEEADEM